MARVLFQTDRQRRPCLYRLSLYYAEDVRLAGVHDYSLEELTPDQYRFNSFFQNGSNSPFRLAAADAFTTDAKGKEVISIEGERQMDQIIGKDKDAIMNQPLFVEGYSSQANAANEMIASR